MEVDKQILLESPKLQLLIDSLLKSSTEYPLDILDKDPHPNDLTLALFAELVYTTKKSRETDSEYGKRLVLPEGWRLLVTASNPDWTNGYFGAAYVHAKSQQVVVAHQGTILSNTGALLTDAFGILGTQYTSCMNSAVTFMDHIRQVVHSANTQYGRSYNLTITGHSLGGWLAQITAVTVKSLSINSGLLENNTSTGFHAKTVVFDSPGARSMLDKVRDVYYDRYTMNVFLDRLNITVYLSAPNRINTCGTHLGKVYRVFTELSNLHWKDYALYNVKTHAISNFVNAFREKSSKISNVVDWAKDAAEYSSLFDILKESNNFHQDLKDDQHNFLLEKLHRYNVAEFKSPKKDEKVKGCLNCFGEDEVQILYKLYVLQEQKTEVKILNDFVSKKNLQLDSSKLFPDFEIDLYNRIIQCDSRKALDVLIKRVKQLMRWLKQQFTEAVEEQMAALPRAVDLIYRAEGRSYLDSLPKTSLNFTDSIGLQNFILSNTDRVLCIVTRDGPFEMTRLKNIFHQIKENINISGPNDKYARQNHYTFLDWPRLEKLNKIYGSPIDQNDLLLVDASSSSNNNSKVRDFLINFEHCPSSTLKKLVCILSQPIDICISLQNIKIVPDRNINLLDLSDESQKKLLRKKLIFAGNKWYSFQEFLGENCTIHEIGQLINSDHLKNIATNDAYIIKIKDTRPTLSDLQMPLFKTNIKTSKQCIVNCVESPNTLVVMSGLNGTGADWDQLAGKEIIHVEGDAEMFFKYTCNKNQHKSIYLFEVSGADVYCKQIFDRGFYLSRKFFHRKFIDLRNFVEIKPSVDLFVICSEEEKALLLGLIENCTEREKFSENVFIAATKEREEDIINQYLNKSIHFVKMNKTHESRELELEWRYSHGSVESLRSCVFKDCCKPIDEQTLSKTEGNLVIITDEPGMGKTTSLAIMSRLLESEWVIYIELKHFQTHIDRLSHELTAENVASFLLSEGCTQTGSLTLTHGLLEYLLQSTTCSKRVVLMFDGFDELDDYIQRKESAKEKLHRLLVFLLSKPTVQIFLTTRDYLKESLESKFGYFSTSLEPINEEEQQNYLFSFWRSCLSLELEDYGEEDEERLKTYARKLLLEAMRVLGTDIRCFMGVPLQLKMMAEAFRPQSDLLVQSPEVLFKQINLFSTTNLYKKFINLKYEIYLHDKTLKSKALDEHEITEYLDSLTKKHGELGFRTFFPDFYDKNFDVITDEWLSKLNRYGLVQSRRNGEFRFVHRTYAEYCCAQMVVHWLSQRDNPFRYQLIKTILLPHILLHPDSKMIRLFINTEFEDKSMSKTALESNAEQISRLWIEDRAIFKNQKNETALHIAVQERSEHIITLLLSGLYFKRTQEAFVSYISEYNNSKDTALNVVNEFLSNTYRGYRSRRSGIQISIKRIMKNILQSIETCSYELKEKVLLASLLNRQISESYVSDFLQHSRSVSCHTRGVFERVKEVLLEYGLFFEAISQNNLKLVRKILFKRLKNNIERYYFLVVNNKNQYGFPTALQYAAQCGHLGVVKLLMEQTAVPLAEMMAQHGGDGDGDGETILLMAAGCDALRVVQYLVKRHGADVNTLGKSGETALMLAASQGHYSTVAYLVKHGAHINSVDEDGENALNKAAKRGHLKTVEYLAKLGADIHHTSKNGQSALHRAAQQGHLPIVKCLIQRGAEVDRVDQMSRSAVYLASRGGHLKVIRHLLQLGADPDTRDAAGQTALSEAALYKKWPVVRLLVERGADVNADGGEALRLATRHGDRSVVEYLLDKGALFAEGET